MEYKCTELYNQEVGANIVCTEDRGPTMEQGASEKKRTARRRPGAERLLEAASDLFYREGIRAVGVDTVSERAGVSKRTLYNRFGGKDELVAEYLRRRDDRWRAYLREATGRVTGPREKLLAVFGAYGEWLVGEDFRGCPFANAAAEIPDPNHPARIVARRHKDGVKEHLVTLAGEAGFRAPEALAERLLLLLEGATATAAMRHSGEPLDVARSVALELMDAHPSL
jgi:AcrR family transcriptional regulator